MIEIFLLIDPLADQHSVRRQLDVALRWLGQPWSLPAFSLGWLGQGSATGQAWRRARSSREIEGPAWQSINSNHAQLVVASMLSLVVPGSPSTRPCQDALGDLSACHPQLFSEAAVVAALAA